MSTSSRMIYKEKNSKFISIATPVNTEIEINEFLKDIKKEFYDANHYCYAYRLGTEKIIYRYSDDGEPSGTAGKPILGQILSFDLTNILVMVIRYFGGTKLGVSGLINAYKTSVRNLLNESVIITKTIDGNYNLIFDYDKMNSVMKVLKEFDIKPIESRFDFRCEVRISVRKGISEIVLKKLSKINGLIVSLDR